MLVRRTQANGRLEEIERFNNRQHCDYDCFAIDKISQNARYHPGIFERKCQCPTCSEVLVWRAQENFSSFAERQHCNTDCWNDDPRHLEHLARMWATPRPHFTFITDATHPNIIASRQTKEFKQLQSKIMKEKWANGEIVPAHHKRRARLLGISEGALTNEEVVAIRADPRPRREIARSYAISVPQVDKIKKMKVYLHVPPSEVFKYPRHRRRPGIPVETPDGRFDSLTAASKHYKIGRTTARRWAEKQLNGWKLCPDQKPVLKASSIKPLDL
jgi:hypothetical protein